MTVGVVLSVFYLLGVCKGMGMETNLMSDVFLHVTFSELPTSSYCHFFSFLLCKLCTTMFISLPFLIGQSLTLKTIKIFRIPSRKNFINYFLHNSKKLPLTYNKQRVQKPF